LLGYLNQAMQLLNGAKHHPVFKGSHERMVNASIGKASSIDKAISVPESAATFPGLHHVRRVSHNNVNAGQQGQDRKTIRMV
jgi:hypothetical protein